MSKADTKDNPQEEAGIFSTLTPVLTEPPQHDTNKSQSKSRYEYVTQDVSMLD
jgi:hypothetical protein